MANFPPPTPQNSGSPQPASDNPAFTNESAFHGSPQPALTHSMQGEHRKKPLGILAVIGAALLKFKTIIFTVLLKFKFLLVLLKTGGSMLVTIWFYSLSMGWKFAAGFVLLIFVHEMGHVIAAWWKKLPVSAPMFIPFFGAFITLKGNPQDALMEAQIAYAGPLFGALGATACLGLYYLTGHPLYLAVASFTLLINLFNMVPVAPLDGGRIVTAISPYVWLLGLVIMTVWFFYSFNFIMLLAIIFGGYRLFHDWKLIGTSAYYQVSNNARLGMGLLYITLLIYLGVGYSLTHTALIGIIRNQVQVASSF